MIYMLGVPIAKAQTQHELLNTDSTQTHIEPEKQHIPNSHENDFPAEIKNDINSVQTLMRLETMQALGKPEQKQPNENIGTYERLGINNRSPNKTSDYTQQPSLKSIYGVGNQLKARVNYKQHSYVYKKGQQYPMGIKKDIKNVLLMTDFTDLCITLVGGSNTYDLCLNN